MTDLHKLTVDELAEEIRRIDGNHDMGAGRLAEALMPYLERALAARPVQAGEVALPEPYTRDETFGFPYWGEKQLRNYGDARAAAAVASMPADWSKDSSLETWFPLTAEELARLRAENERLRAVTQVGGPEGNVIHIPAGDKLDPIIAYFEDEAPGKGRITIACYGDAWTAWWGGMGNRTVREFVAGVDAGYLCGALLQLRGANDSHRAYTLRVAARVISALAAATQTPAGEGEPISLGIADDGTHAPAGVPEEWAERTLLPLLEGVAGGGSCSIAAGDVLRELRRMLSAASPNPSANLSAEMVTDAMVERAMRARIPGGSEAWVWLFNCEGGMRPEEKHRDWFRRVLTAAAISRRQAVADLREVLTTWILENLREGDEIGDPKWWADRISRVAERAFAARSAHTGDVAGFVIADGQGKRWRLWGESGPEWTTDKDAALRFSRREDAEAVARGDEDAWLIQSVGTPPAQAEGAKVFVLLDPADLVGFARILERDGDEHGVARGLRGLLRNAQLAAAPQPQT